LVNMCKIIFGLNLAQTVSQNSSKNGKIFTCWVKVEVTSHSVGWGAGNRPPRKNLPKTASKLLLRAFHYAYVPKVLSYFKSARPNVFNALSTISIAHTERSRSASKVASWKQNDKIKKYRFFNFFIRPKETSILTEYSSRPYSPPITWS